MLDSFDALLQAARQEPEPQRLLLVFLRVGLPDDADQSQQRRFDSGMGGSLEPIMYVDKGENEIADFDALVEESRQMSDNRDLLLVGCMPGQHGVEPTSEDAETPLHNIIESVRLGRSLAHLAAFDRQGYPVQFQ